MLQPEFPYGRPVRHDDGPLVAKETLEDRRFDLLAPLREDGAVILARSATESIEVADKGQSIGDFGDAWDPREVGMVCFCLCFGIHIVSKKHRFRLAVIPLTTRTRRMIVTTRAPNPLDVRIVEWRKSTTSTSGVKTILLGV